MKHEERRRQAMRLLLDTAKALIREKGCNSLTMKDIMDSSGLSKGAIFHYVRSKDEIFVRVLNEQLEQTNDRFMREVELGNRTFDAPMSQIAAGLFALEHAQDVTNKVLMYLLGKEDQPLIAEALRQYHERSVELSRQWIEIGQRHGVISAAVDAAKAADMFVLLAVGIRVRSTIPVQSVSFGERDFTAFIAGLLKLDDTQKEE